MAKGNNFKSGIHIVSVLIIALYRLGFTDYCSCIVVNIGEDDSLCVRARPTPLSDTIGFLTMQSDFMCRSEQEQKYRSSTWYNIRIDTIVGWVNACYIACRLPSQQAQSIIDTVSRRVIKLIKNYDIQGFSKYVHPIKGVRFSPYSYVDFDNDRVFKAPAIASLGNDKRKWKWGYADGSGELIMLTFKGYFARFVYDRDFIRANQIGYNATIGTGNTQDNNFQAYPNAIMVEYYVPGSSETDGSDWASLRLLFEKYQNTWYVVGIIHDQRTI